MISWIFGVIVIVLSLGWGLLVMTANMMSDDPSDKASAWPCAVGLLVGIAIIVGHHFGAW